MQHDGVDYEADKHGMFTVPEHIGQALIKFPHWVQEHVALARGEASKLAHDVQPEHIIERVTQLEGDLAGLASKVEQLLGIVAKVAPEAAAAISVADPAAAPAAAAVAGAVEAANATVDKVAAKVTKATSAKAAAK
jgi:hypothetical protein